MAIIVACRTLLGAVHEASRRIASAVARRSRGVRVDARDERDGARMESCSAALPEADGTRSLVRDLQDGGIPVRSLPCIDPWEGGRPPTGLELWSATRRTARIVRGMRADVVHVTLAWPSFGLSSLLAAAILNVPAVVVALVPEQVWLPWPRAVYRATRRRRQRWVGVSQHGQRLIASAMRLPARSIDHIPNGVPNVDTWAMDPDERTRTRAAVRSKLGLPPTSRLVLAVGRLHAQKGHADLCRAAAPVLERLYDVYVAVAGDGPDRYQLQQLTDELGPSNGRFLWLGHRDDVASLLAASDLFAFPSRFEGMPLALLEAMAAGVPLVTAAFPGVEEIVQDRRDGIVVPVGDVPALTNALEWVLRNPDAVSVMARSAQARAREFSQERMLERTLSLLAESASLTAREPIPPTNVA